MRLRWSQRKRSVGVVQVPASDQVAGFVVLVRHQRPALAWRGGVDKEQVKNPPVAVRFDDDGPPKRIDDFTQAAVSVVAKVDLGLSLPQPAERSRVAGAAELEALHRLAGLPSS